jgi:hypothetical protein
MKRFNFLFLFVLGLSLQVQAQNDSVKTLWTQNSKLEIKRFFEPEIGLHFYNNTFNEKAAMLVGAKLGWIINKHLIVGIVGYGKVTPTYYTHEYRYMDDNENEVVVPNQKMAVGYGYGGLVLGTILHPHEAIHINLITLLGFGTSNEYIIQSNGSHGTTFNSPSFFVAEPKINLELNLSKSLRFEIGSGYRFIDASRFTSLSSSALSGFTLHTGIKIGIF